MIIKCQLSLDLSGVPAFPYRKLVKVSCLITSHTDSIVFKGPKGLESTMQVNTGTKKYKAAFGPCHIWTGARGWGATRKEGLLVLVLLSQIPAIISLTTLLSPCFLPCGQELVCSDCRKSKVVPFIKTFNFSFY